MLRLLPDVSTSRQSCLPDCLPLVLHWRCTPPQANTPTSGWTARFRLWVSISGIQVLSSRRSRMPVYIPTQVYIDSSPLWTFKSSRIFLLFSLNTPAPLPPFLGSMVLRGTWATALFVVILWVDSLVFPSPLAFLAGCQRVVEPSFLFLWVSIGFSWAVGNAPDIDAPPLESALSATSLRVFRGAEVDALCTSVPRPLDLPRLPLSGSGQLVGLRLSQFRSPFNRFSAVFTTCFLAAGRGFQNTNKMKIVTVKLFVFLKTFRKTCAPTWSCVDCLIFRFFFDSFSSDVLFVFKKKKFFLHFSIFPVFSNVSLNFSCFFAFLKVLYIRAGRTSRERFGRSRLRPTQPKFSSL